MCAGTIDGYRLCNGDGAKTTRIKAVDLATSLRLGDCAGEGLAGSGTTARLCVIADAGNPSSRGLRDRWIGGETKSENEFPAKSFVRRSVSFESPILGGEVCNRMESTPALRRVTHFRSHAM